MKIICLTVGKKHTAGLAEMISEYETRLRPYVDFEFEYIPPSDKVVESAAILRRIKPEDAVFLLDEHGDMIDTPALSRKFEALHNKSVKRLFIVIGGAYGVDESVFDRSDEAISLSKLVFPHQIVRLIAIEQVYRCYNLLAGGKYHHS